jgi:peptidyl-prolyl cis-trans isomerase D
MALIGKIRQRSWILFGFIAVALLIFILEAALDRNSMFGGGGNGKDAIAKVDGSKISLNQYSSGITQYEEGLKMLNPNFQSNEQTQAQIQEEVWTTIVSNKLLENAYTSLGLNVSEAEMGDLMWGSMPHPLAQQFIMRARQVKPEIINKQGQVDQVQMREFVSNLAQIDKQNKSNFREMLGYIENLIKEDQVKQKYASLVAQSFYMPTFMAKEVVNSGRAAKTAYVAVPYATLPDDKYKVSDAEITEYIKAHASRFEQEATRIVDVVSFSVIPSSEDTAQALTKINTMRADYLAATPNDSAFIARNSIQGDRVDFYSKQEVTQTNRNADTLFNLPLGTLTNVYKEGSFYMFTKILDRRLAPDTVRAAHILLSLGSGTDEDKAKANALADSLIREMASGQKPFGQLAAENSLDQGSKDKGGDLGYFSRGQMVQAFNDKVFYSGMQPNQIAKVESQYGLHVILLIDIKAPTVVTKFADFVVELTPGDETEKLAYDNAVNFQQKNQTVELFDKAAKTQDVAKNVVLTQNMVDVPQLGAARKLVQWAFQQEKTDIIEFFDNDNRYMIAKLSKITKKGLPSAEDVRVEVSMLVRNEKKGKDLVAQLNKAAVGTTDLKAIAAKVKDAFTVDTALVRFSSAYVAGLGNEPKLVGSVFGIPVDKISTAIAGEQAAFMVQPKNIEQNTPEMAGDINEYKKQMQRMYISRLNFQSIFDAIKKKANIEDTRYKFY